MAIGQVDVQIGKDTSGELEMTLRGKPEAIVGVLVKGVSVEDLRKIEQALGAELLRHDGK